MAYRRCKEKDIWHFCENCPNWPTADYEEWLGGYAFGPLCEDCKELARAGIGHFGGTQGE
ncbi:MAG: hypothetical protein MI741_12265 [Rhodospirillales bacterium]|nr:hypothetical protein [Rhodospirillales bacterium]